ncbi:hypothetical protein LA345_23220 [Burkholderia vietnamiensis]|nr:hypothetical protein [Burkholderia vietnamiensis]
MAVLKNIADLKNQKDTHKYVFFAPAMNERDLNKYAQMKEQGLSAEIIQTKNLEGISNLNAYPNTGIVELFRKIKDLTTEHELSFVCFEFNNQLVANLYNGKNRIMSKPFQDIDLLAIETYQNIIDFQTEKLYNGLKNNLPNRENKNKVMKI